MGHRADHKMMDRRVVLLADIAMLGFDRFTEVRIIDIALFEACRRENVRRGENLLSRRSFGCPVSESELSTRSSFAALSCRRLALTSRRRATLSGWKTLPAALTRRFLNLGSHRRQQLPVVCNRFQQVCRRFQLVREIRRGRFAVMVGIEIGTEFILAQIPVVKATLAGMRSRAKGI